jgi:uncharacterized protein
METPIGKALESRGRSRSVAAVAALAVVGCDMLLLANHQTTVPRRFGLAVIAVLVNGALATLCRDRASFGFRLSPIQGWMFWWKVTLLLAAIVFGVLAASAVVAYGIFRHSVPPPRYITHPSQIGLVFFWMCIYAPLTEEPLYRLAICPPVAAWIGPKAAIAVSGVAFALAHVLGGNPSPDNQIAGFLLAWAYLRSGSLMVPIVIHALGNLCAFGFHLAWFYWG